MQITTIFTLDLHLKPGCLLIWLLYPLQELICHGPGTSCRRCLHCRKTLANNEQYVFPRKFKYQRVHLHLRARSQPKYVLSVLAFLAHHESGGIASILTVNEDPAQHIERDAAEDPSFRKCLSISRSSPYISSSSTFDNTTISASISLDSPTPVPRLP